MLLLYNFLGCSQGQVIQIVDELVKCNIRFVAVKEAIGFDGKQDLQTKAMIALFGLFAEAEKDLIFERTKEGMAGCFWESESTRRRSSGLWVPPVRPCITSSSPESSMLQTQKAAQAKHALSVYFYTNLVSTLLWLLPDPIGASRPGLVDYGAPALRRLEAVETEAKTVCGTDPTCPNIVCWQPLMGFVANRMQVYTRGVSYVH